MISAFRNIHGKAATAGFLVARCHRRHLSAHSVRNHLIHVGVAAAARMAAHDTWPGLKVGPLVGRDNGTTDSAHTNLGYLHQRTPTPSPSRHDDPKVMHYRHVFGLDGAVGLECIG